MAEQLTPQQRLAVENRGGRLLVSAAAGSGKTKVLVDRLMSYLTDPRDPANIDDFLLITYTKAAAAELRGKIAAKLTERVSQTPDNAHLRRQLQRLYLTKISTVHSFCGDILREYAYRLDIPGDFRVADETECSELRQRVLEKMLTECYVTEMEDGAFRAFLDTQGLGRDDRQVPQLIQQVYDASRCHLDPEKWLTECEEMISADGLTDAGESIYGKALMEQFFDWLDLQIVALEACIAETALTVGFEKIVLLLGDTVAQLRDLRSCQTWDQIAQSKGIDFGRMVFPKSATDESLKERIKAVRDACKKGLEKKLKPFADPSARVLADLGSAEEAVRGLTALVRRFAQQYDGVKRSRRILDFGDLEHRMLDLLLGKSRSGYTVAAEDVASRFREVMVDEYQDSNQVQDAIYHALTRRRGNLFMVGDVKQSIYQFRLADPGIFMEKYRTFLPAEQALPGQDRKVVLSKNFRSSAGVLEGCNDVFRTCMCPQVGGMYYGPEEALYEGVPHTPLSVPETELCCIDVQEHTYPEEAAFVADHIRQLLKNGQVRQGEKLRPVQPEDIVILLRSPGSAGGYFQRELEKLGIRYTTGGGIDLLQTEEIATVHAILQVIHNPRLDIPLVAALSSPAFGFTADDLAALRSKHISCAFYDALLQDQTEKSIEFLHTLQNLRSAMRHFSLTRLLEQVLLETSMEEIYGAMEDGQMRLENLQAFFQLAADFEAMGNRDLGRFLEHLEVMEQKGLMTAGGQSTAGCVTIMSIHKSKGLEFPVVYLCGLGREFNMESQRASILCHKSLGLGLSAVDGRNRLRYPTIAKRAIASRIGMESISEELRVLYVAMTRAKDRLIMTYASPRLEKDLAEIVQRLDMGGKELLIREAVCPGEWVLLTALQKTESGALFALTDKPRVTNIGAHPWKIRVATAPQPVVATLNEQEKCAIPEKMLTKIRENVNYSYEYLEATQTPSKQTATGLKGRQLDQEAAEHTDCQTKVFRQWRKPTFVQDRKQATDYGNAMHTAMQYLSFDACSSEEAVCADLNRLVQQGHLSQEQASIVDAGAIVAFFQSELGRKVQTGNVVREFKFSLLVPADTVSARLSEEKILLQGVVDCALVEDDGITLIDFKTDAVDDNSLPQKIAQYTPQIMAYAQAMERIYQKPVRERFLYFFTIDRFAAV